ncbi:MAG: excinuclease ABC subunit UvrA [Prevotellaceae bacterium]|nr:excinuclease ABC subunit UvrA [Prevotellaceae bacterium]
MLSEKYIDIKGARANNLKNIDIRIPRNKLIVLTGLSGSGKSTLAFDTIFAEGQRRYIMSLSSYIRQFLGKVNKPEVDSITGIPPAIAIDQKVNSYNSRSTVGTSTEIYDYMKLLFARIGRTYSPVSGDEVKEDTVTDVVNYFGNRPVGEKMLILSPIDISEQNEIIEILILLVDEGFSRIFIIKNNVGEVVNIKDFLVDYDKKYKRKKLLIYLLVDRVVVSLDESVLSRVADSVQQAFNKGKGYCHLYVYPDGGKPFLKKFSDAFEIDGIYFEKPTVNLFGFNNSFGACPRCKGHGKVSGIDESLVVPNKSLSIYGDAITCWKGDTMKIYKEKLIYSAHKFNFPIHRPYFELSEQNRRLLWTGNKWFDGLNSFFEMLEANKYKVQYRSMLARYTGKTLCPECQGSRLRQEANYIRVGNKTMSELIRLTIKNLQTFFNNLKLTDYEAKVVARVMIEIKTRLQCLLDLGLGYLTLNRLSSTLSGGESQRINLSAFLGSSLVGSLYILDEPSVGLHPKDNLRLIKVLKELRDLGNTVIVVEHEEEIMNAADEIIDIGPLSGDFGGEVVFQGKISGATKKDVEKSLTLKYLKGLEKIEVPTRRRKLNKYIAIKEAVENNLKNINVKIPLNGIVAITGVSGSGKSTLIHKVFYPALARILSEGSARKNDDGKISGDIGHIKSIEVVDQNPIGKSSRSNPITYTKIYDDIRKLFASQPRAVHNNFSSSHFSFNIDGGRCEVCQGEGSIKVEMQFMSNVVLKCESCNGKRFKDTILEIKYKDKNIHDILEMSIDEAIPFFKVSKDSTAKKIAQKLAVLQKVGLGYIKLGQPSSTLSGGESQRVKLAFFLLRDSSQDSILFIFDEPTTGLHFHDIRKLVDAFNVLVDKGHSVIVIEHNPEVIKCADRIIDLGPESGDDGGYLVFEGTPEELIKCKKSYTGKYLKNKI